MHIESGSFDDLDHYRKQLENWDVNFKQLSGGKSYVSYKYYRALNWNFFGIFHKQAIQFDAFALSDGLTFFIPDAGNQHLFVGQRRQGDHISIVPRDEYLQGFTLDNFMAYSVAINSDLIRSTAASMGQFDIPSELMSNTLAVYCSNEVLQALSEKLRKASQLLTSFNSGAQEFAVKLEMLMVDEIIPMLVSILVSHEKGEAELLPYWSAKTRHLKKSIDIITDNLDSPPSIKELACAVGTSTRNLQLVFQEYLKVTPKEYIKALRLNRVRLGLKSRAAPNSRGLISSLANEMGYWHMGQFSKEFKNLFGQTPSSLIKDCRNLDRTVLTNERA